MKVRHYEDMNLQELNVMKGVSSIDTSHVAMALSKLFSKEIRITLPEVNVLKYKEVVSRVGDPEEIITAVLAKMSGDMEGPMLFLSNLEPANTVLDELMGESSSDFTEFDEISYSTLAEVGNITICPYINAFSQLVGVEMELSIPSATVNMFGDALTIPIVEYGYEIDKLMYSNADFATEGKKLPG